MAENTAVLHVLPKKVHTHGHTVRQLPMFSSQTVAAIGGKQDQLEKRHLFFFIKIYLLSD
jgi:hypothetical protein